MRRVFQNNMIAAAIAMIAALAGCSDLLEAKSRRINSARVTVEGTSPVPMLLITSTNFFAGRDPAGNVHIDFTRADTARIQLPFDRTFTFDRTDRFVVRLANADTASTATIEMVVYIDGRQDFRQRATMRNSSLQYTFYNYF